ncbi:MAG: glucose 1-dehydrogenase [Sphingomonas taxi]
MMERILAGRVAIVTGAAAGMGAATGRLFAEAGAQVMLSDVAEDGAAVAEAIVAGGGSAAFFAADVSDEAAVRALVAETVARFGRLDCAVNNARIGDGGRPLAELDMARFDRVMAVNVRGVALGMKYQIAQMMAQGDGGAIVNIASTASVRPRPNSPAYVASKHAVIGLTKAGSLDYAPHGIRINAVMPGVIATPMVEETLARLGKSEADVAAELSLLGRMGRPEEVAQASLWLCSPAASFVTGHAMAVDAGLLAR